MWVNANAITCYGLMRYGFDALAMKIATRVTATLADDLRNTTQWHEAYSTADGASERTFLPSFVCDTLVSCTETRSFVKTGSGQTSGNMTKRPCRCLLSVVC